MVDKTSIPASSIPFEPSPEPSKSASEEIVSSTKGGREYVNVRALIAKFEALANPAQTPELQNKVELAQRAFETDTTVKNALEQIHKQEQVPANQQKILSKELTARVKSPATKMPFSREIELGAEALKMKQLSRHIVDTSLGKEGAYELESMGQSQNPVAKLGGVQYLPRKVLEDNLKPAPVNLMSVGQIIDSCCSKMPKNLRTKVSEACKEPIIKVFENPNDPTIKNERPNEASLQNTVLKIIEKVKTIASDNTDEVQTNKDSLNELLQNLEKTVALPSLENVSKLYDKDEVLSRLRAISATTNAPNILLAIQHLSAQNQQYISEERLIADFEHTFNLNLRPHLTEYVSAIDFAVANKANAAAAATSLKQAAVSTKIDEPEYVFKRGHENTRELLANTLVASLGLATPLVPKFNVGQLVGAKLGAAENPEGIASRFVHGKPFPRELWDRMMQAKQDLALAKFRERELPELKAEAEDLRSQYDDLKDQIADLKTQREALTKEIEKLEAQQDLTIAKLITQVWAEQSGLQKMLDEDPSLKANPSLREGIENQVAELEKKKGSLNKQKLEFDNLPKNKKLRKQIKEKAEELNDKAFEIRKLEESIREMPFDRIASIEKHIIEATNNYNQIANEIKALGDSESIVDHALTDALFCSYDSHFNQYIVNDGKVLNIDFARFMAPSETYQRDGATFAALRSTWLDHPVVEDTLSTEKRSQILSWNLNEIEQRWREDGLIGDAEVFKSAEQSLQHLDSTLEFLGNSKNSLKSLEAAKNQPEKHIAFQLELFDNYHLRPTLDILTMRVLLSGAPTENSKKLLLTDETVIANLKEQFGIEPSLEALDNLLKGDGKPTQETAAKLVACITPIMVNSMQKALEGKKSLQEMKAALSNQEVIQITQKQVEEEIQLQIDKRRSELGKEVNNTLNKVGNELGMNLEPGIDLTTLSRSVSKRIIEEEARLKKECYSKIHPEAFAAFKLRLTSLQEYVKANPESANLKEAVYQMLPNMAPFLKVGERMFQNPSETIGIKEETSKLIDQGPKVQLGRTANFQEEMEKGKKEATSVSERAVKSLQRRSLESILEQADTSKMATTEEITQMKEAIARIKQEPSSLTPLITTMDLS